MVVAGLALLTSACASSRARTPVEPTPTYDFTQEGSFPPPPEVTPRAATPSAAASGDTTETTSTQRGWRVQVFAGASEEQARAVAANVRNLVTAPVYVDYLAPLFKVRVGDCELRPACEALLQQLQDAGLESAWVVPSPIQH